MNRYDAAYNAAFPAGVYTPSYGPPLDYHDGTLRALGGNPVTTPYLQGAIRPPEPNEAGWKDVAIMYPGQVTRIAVRYAPTDAPAGAMGHYPFDPNSGAGHGYVVHRHINDHEDNEMMRPLQVQPVNVDGLHTGDRLLTASAIDLSDGADAECMAGMASSRRMTHRSSGVAPLEGGRFGA